MKEYKRLTKGKIDLTKLSEKAKSRISDTYLDYAKINNALWELENKIENGTLIELPYKLGTKLYFLVLHMFGGYFEIFETDLWVYISRYKDEFGGVDFAIEINDVNFDYETWVIAHCYSTKAEAEAKLKEVQNER